MERLLNATLSVKPTLAYCATTLKEYSSWVESVKGCVKALSSYIWEPVSVKPVSQEERPGSLIAEEFDFTISRNNVFRALVLRPKAGLANALLFCQGRTASLDEISGRPGFNAPDRDGLKHYNGMEILAKRGFGVLAIDYGLLGSFNPENIQGRDEINLLGLALGLVGRSIMQELLQRTIASLYFLSSCSWKKSEPIGIVGRSLGGQVALHTSLLAPTPVITALACSMGTYVSMYGERQCVGAAHALPGILRYADLPDLACALAPAPLLIQHGLHDTIMPERDAAVAACKIQKAYDLHEAGNNFVFDRVNRHHGADISRIADFFAEVYACEKR